MKRFAKSPNQVHVTGIGKAVPEPSAICKAPNRCGGEACIRDTRIPVWLLVNYRRLGGTEDMLRCNYPSLSPADLEAARDYAASHAEEIDKAIQENEESEKASDIGPTHSQRSPESREIDPNLEVHFNTLVAEWKASRGHVASINKWVQLPAYQNIIRLGAAAIPLLLKELARSPDHWFWALRSITGENPVTSESRGNVIEMAKCWIQWGKEHGYGSEGN